MTFDVVVAGAGIVGSAVARECALAGLRTAVVEAAQPAGATTAAGMGHVVVLDDGPDLLALTKYSRGVWQELRMPEYATRGTLWVAADDEEMAAAEIKGKVLRDAGVEAEVLGGAGLRACEPQLREGLAGGLLVPGDGICAPPIAARFLLDEAQRLGAELVAGRVLAARDGAVELEDGRELRAERIVLATGTDAALLPGIPLRKRKGQLLLTAARAGFVRRQVVEMGYVKSAHGEADVVVCNVQPRPDGTMLIGASRQWTEDEGVDAAISARLLERACGYLPGLRGVDVVGARTGFRAATTDGLPVMGKTSDATVWVCLGFEGYGITCAPGAARLLVDAMMGREPAVDCAAFSAERFRSEEKR